MNRNEELLKRIKRLSWNTKENFQKLNPLMATTSTYRMVEKFSPPFDAVESATKASNNPNNPMFGKPIDEIIKAWEEKRNSGKDRGNSIDDYIRTKILGGEMDCGDDPIFINKCKGVDKFYDEFLSKVDTFVGDEIWLSSKHGINVRCDGLFKHGNTIIVGEWKNIENFKTNNRLSKCFGLLDGYDNCDLLKVNIQVYTYKLILEEYFGDEFTIKPLIVNFVENDYNIIPTLFDSRYKDLIPKLAKESLPTLEQVKLEKELRNKF